MPFQYVSSKTRSSACLSRVVVGDLTEPWGEDARASSHQGIEGRRTPHYDREPLRTWAGHAAPVAVYENERRVRMAEISAGGAWRRTVVAALRTRRGALVFGSHRNLRRSGSDGRAACSCARRLQNAGGFPSAWRHWGRVGHSQKRCGRRPRVGELWEFWRRGCRSALTREPFYGAARDCGGCLQRDFHWTCSARCARAVPDGRQHEGGPREAGGRTEAARPRSCSSIAT